MFIVMGATGHVGAAVTEELLARGEEVTILTRHSHRAGAWQEKGAVVAVADADDVGSLARAFRPGRRAFLLNPPADPKSDSDTIERRTITNILAAVKDSGLEKVVAASTYGAQPGDAIGDLSTLWELEEGLRAQSIPAAINRGAYYMTNWLGFADAVRQSGVLLSMFPANFEMPMVAPLDLGRGAVERLLTPIGDVGVHCVEGPARYTPRDVADAFASALDRDVSVEVAPREQWDAVYQRAGFSPAAARAYVRMTAATLDNGFDPSASAERGSVDLHSFIASALTTKA